MPTRFSAAISATFQAGAVAATVGATALLVCAGLATANDDPGAARGGVPQIGELPASLDLIVAAQDLSRMRASDGGRALMAFLSEVGGWERSAVALTDLGTAMDLPADRTLDELVGASCILGLKGAWAGSQEGRTQTSLLSAISVATERRVRERLRPAPRGVESGLPILALEDGAVELSTAINSIGGGQILLSPRGSTGLFDEMLEVMSNGAAPPSRRLSKQPWWTPSIDALVRRPLAILLHDQTGETREEARQRETTSLTAPRDDASDGTSDRTRDRTRDRASDVAGDVSSAGVPRFFALGGDVDDRGFTGSFLASDSMILSMPGEAEPALPRGVLARLEADAALLLAGTASPASRAASSGQGAQGADGAAQAMSPPGGMLLDAVLGMMHAPDDLRARWTGPVVLAVHERPAARGSVEPPAANGAAKSGVSKAPAASVSGLAESDLPGVSATLAIRVDSLRDAATSVHAWLTSFAEEAAELRLRETLDRAPLGLVRVLMISANEDGPMEGYLRGGGSVAWTFVADGAEQPARGRVMPGESMEDAQHAIEQGPGWWVVCVTTTPRREAETRDMVDEVSRVLREDTPMAGLYHRLVLRPARLAVIAAANRPAVHEAAPSPQGVGAQAQLQPLAAELRTGTSRSLRWLDAVSTSVSRAGPGVVEGRVVVRMDTTLLRK